MNHACHGDIFTRWGKKYGRCLLGGDVFEYFEGLEFCPICERPFDPVDQAKDSKDWDPSRDANVAVMIDIPHYKRALAEKSRKVKFLEQELARMRELNLENLKRLKELDKPC